MNAMIIFDVSENTALVKQKLFAKTYFAAWNVRDARYNLPSNCVWKPNCELSQAKLEIEEVIRQLNQEGVHITLLRCIVVSASPWEGIQGTLVQGDMVCGCPI